MMRRGQAVTVGLTAVLAGGLTFLATRAAYTQPGVMGSSVFDWSSFKATPTKTGEVRKVFQAPTATLDELECHITTLRPGESPHAPHQHPDEEVIVIKEGTIETFQDGQTTRVGPGSIIFQAANKMHSVKNVGETPATYFVFKWNSPGMLKAREKAKAD